MWQALLRGCRWSREQNEIDATMQLTFYQERLKLAKCVGSLPSVPSNQFDSLPPLPFLCPLDTELCRLLQLISLPPGFQLGLANGTHPSCQIVLFELPNTVSYVNSSNRAKEDRGRNQDAVALSAAIRNEPENYLKVANIILGTNTKSYANYMQITIMFF